MRFSILTTAFTAGFAVAVPAPQAPTATRIPSAEEIQQEASHEALQSAMAEIWNGPLPFGGPLEFPSKRSDLAPAAPAEDYFSPAHKAYAEKFNEGWKIAREFILRNSTNGSDFQEVVKEKSMGVIVARWFEKAHGNSSGDQLLDGYPAELDGFVLDLFKGVRRFHGEAWPRLNATDFDEYEKHTLNFTGIGSNEIRNSGQADKVEGHHHTRRSILSWLMNNPDMDNFDDDQMVLMRNFLAEPAVGFASSTLGSGCDVDGFFPRTCGNASLLAAATTWASLYPHETKSEPRQDWLTIFDKVQWWQAKMNVTSSTIGTMPFREITEGWEKTFVPPPPPERCGGPLEPPCLGPFIRPLGGPFERK